MLALGRRVLVTVATLAVGAALVTGCSSAGSQSSAQTLHGMGFGKMPQSIIDGFKKKTGITVTWDYQDSSTFPQVLQSRVSAKAALDIINLRGGAEFNKYATAHSFVPLTGQSFLDNVSNGGLAPGNVNGTQYGYSASSYVIGVFYNESLFAKNHLQPPTTWQDFLNICATLKASGVAPLVGSEGEGWTNQYYYHAAIAEYAKAHPTFMRDLKTGKAKWRDNNLFTDQVDRFGSLVNDGYFLDGTQSFKAADAQAAFESGKAAMWTMGDWSLADLHPQGFTPGAFALPFTANAPASSLSDNMFAVTSWSKKGAAAKEFLAYLTQKDVAKTYAEADQRATTIKNVSATISPYQADWDKLLPDSVPFPSNIGPSVNGSGGDLLGDLFAHKSTPAKVVNGFQKLQDNDNATGY